MSFMSTGNIQIYQFKVHLRGISPQIIRRIHVRSDTTLAQLHGILQIIMGWGDDYLHKFHIYGKDYGISYIGGLSFRDNPREVKISDFGFRRGEYFTYEYNFFSNWIHILRIEKILEPKEKRFYPVCIDSKRVPPSEECRESSDLYYVVNKILEKLEERNDGDMDFYKLMLNEDFDRVISSRKIINNRLKKQDHHELENMNPAEILEKQ